MSHSPETPRCKSWLLACSEKQLLWKGRHCVVVNTGSWTAVLPLGPGGVWALCAVLGFQSALSPWWWLCSVQVLLEQQRWDEMRKGCACPHSSAAGEFPWSVPVLQLQCGWWFLRVQLQSRGAPITQGLLRAGQLHRAAPSHHLATGKMHKSGAVPSSVEPIIQFLNDLCFLFASWWKQVGKILGADKSNCIIFTFW